MGLTDGNIR